MGVRPGKKGFVLLLSVMLLLSISVIAGAFISMAITRTRSVAAGLDSAKAFWLAEAGIQQSINRITADAAYRNTPSGIIGSLGDGTYTVSVVKQTGLTVYNVTSTGTAAGVSRSIGQTVTFASTGWARPFTDYGVFLGGGSITLQNSANRITGDVYTVGSVITQSSSSVIGTVYANSGSGHYTRLPLPIPNIPAPALTTTYYTTLINTARTYIRRDKIYYNLNLAGGTVYVNGSVTATNITGPGIIVCTGDFMGGGTVGTDVTIISDARLSMANKSYIQTGAVMYASSNISISGDNQVFDNVALITPGTVTLDSKNLIVNGVIFCGNDLILKKSGIVTGAVVSGRNITMSDSSDIIQDRSQLPLKVPNGIASGVSASSVSLSKWQGS
jgi:hypothetical protein